MAMADFDLSILRQQLPSGVLLEVAPVKDHLNDLLPEERALVEAAVASRRFEFSSARCLARRLLTDLGAKQQPLLPNADRSPIWPQGVIGSLSHSRRFCATAVARPESHVAAGLLGIGVDLEDMRPLRTPLFAELLTERELQQLDPHASQEQQANHVLATFSIKEAVYKAMSPINNDGLAFHDVEIQFEPDVFRDPCLKKATIIRLDGLSRRLPPNCMLTAYQLTQNQSFVSIVSITQSQNAPK